MSISKQSAQSKLRAFNQILIPVAAMGVLVLTLKEVHQERTYGWVLFVALILGQGLTLVDELGSWLGRPNARIRLTLTAIGGGAAVALVSLANPELWPKLPLSVILLAILCWRSWLIEKTT